MDDTPYSAKLQIKRIHIADVTIRGQVERLSWIRTGRLSVNVLITETVRGHKVTLPKVIAALNLVESDDQIKATLRDYVRRQNDPALEPLPLRSMVPTDTEVDEEVELDRASEPLFGAPR